MDILIFESDKESQVLYTLLLNQQEEESLLRHRFPIR